MLNFGQLKDKIKTRGVWNGRIKKRENPDCYNTKKWLIENLKASPDDITQIEDSQETTINDTIKENGRQTL